MRCRSASWRAAAPLVLLLLAWHARPVGSTDNLLAKLWAKAPPRAPSAPAPAALCAGAGAAPHAVPAPGAAVDADLGAGATAGAAGAGAGASGGSHGAGAGAATAGAAAAGAVASAAAAPWKPNTRGRGRPPGSRDKKPRAKRARREGVHGLCSCAVCRLRPPAWLSRPAAWERRRREVVRRAQGLRSLRLRPQRRATHAYCGRVAAHKA